MLLIEYVDGTLDTIEIGTEHKAKMGFRILVQDEQIAHWVQHENGAT